MKDLSLHYWDLAADLKIKVREERAKRPNRTEVLNWIADKRSLTKYLEIGVRDPADNFLAIRCAHKTSVDPGLEFDANPVDYKMTSDEFHAHWKSHTSELGRYELVFIDGLHRADQVMRDIEHALEMTEDHAVIVLHDCNPPNLETAREEYSKSGVASGVWNGTTWKAMYRYFFEGHFESLVIDSDWGIGIIDKTKPSSPTPNPNPFYEFDRYISTRTECGLLRTWEFAASWIERGQ
jgi:hypothetical protein